VTDLSLQPTNPSQYEVIADDQIVGRIALYSAAGLGQFGAIQGVAPSFGIELKVVDVREAPEIERAVQIDLGAPFAGRNLLFDCLS
jgi:hypothetical protein